MYPITPPQVPTNARVSGQPLMYCMALRAATVVTLFRASEATVYVIS